MGGVSLNIKQIGAGVEVGNSWCGGWVKKELF